jgi:predicted AAA+ superfamily ATPase
MGMRQAGKTTMARQLANDIGSTAVYLDLESPKDREKLRDPEYFLEQFADHLVILDEIQVMPELFGILRSLVDRDRRPGRFLLLGSSAPGLVSGVADSLAGRVAYAQLYPIDMDEVSDSYTNRLWLRGGLPEPFLKKSDDAALKWLDNYVKSYVERDLPQLGIGGNAVFLYRLLQMLAHFHGQLINYDQIAKSLQVSSPTVRRYVEKLEQALLIYTLPPLFVNIKRRLVKSPKIYFVDTGMLHSLLNIHSLEDLFGHPQAGASWEGHLISQIKSIVGDKYQYSFYRTQAGAEIDLVLSRGGQHIYAVEIKLSDSPNVSRGYYGNLNIIGAKHNIVLTPGSEKFFVREGVGVDSIRGFIEELLLSK